VPSEAPACAKPELRFGEGRLAKESWLRKHNIFYVYLIQSEAFPEQRYIGFTANLLRIIDVAPCAIIVPLALLGNKKILLKISKSMSLNQEYNKFWKFVYNICNCK
jgi:hypothetical protein